MTETDAARRLRIFLERIEQRLPQGNCRGGDMRNLLSPARVASLKRHREISEVRIRAGRGLAHLRFQNPGTIRLTNPARIRSVIAAILPWRREARSLRRILSRVASRFGPNLFRRFTAAGTCFSFLRSLLKFFQEPRSGVTYALNLAPAFLSVPAVHVTNMAQERSENAEIKAGNIRNVVR